MDQQYNASEETVSLYQEWKKLYPRYQTGFFRRLRWWLNIVLLAVWILLPLWRWERAGDVPDQAVLFDLPGRKFYLFDLIVWPQEVYLLAVLLIFAAIALFFITSLAGRVFCGYFCIQTVWTDLFLFIEYLVEGNRKQRMRLDQTSLNGNKLAVKLLKHAVWLLISLATGVVFVGYFIDVPTLWRQFWEGSVPLPAWFTVGFVATATYIMAGFAREQVCIYMCPYSRFQGAMFDEDSLIVAYHPELGELRQGNRRVRQADRGAFGACIDCKQCVTVCPTGIDIREGQQYQCITCAACIDACDEVMARLRQNVRLIRYTSMREMSGKATQFIRTRILVYISLMVVLFGGIVLHFVLRPSVELNVMRHRQPLYIALSDGGIQNNYTLRILNMSQQDQQYRLRLDGLPGAVLSFSPAVAKDVEPLFNLKAGEVMPFTVYVRQQASQVTPGQVDVRFILEARNAQGGQVVHRSSFMAPNNFNH